MISTYIITFYITQPLLLPCTCSIPRTFFEGQTVGGILLVLQFHNHQLTKCTKRREERKTRFPYPLLEIVPQSPSAQKGEKEERQGSHTHCLKPPPCFCLKNIAMFTFALFGLLNQLSRLSHIVGLDKVFEFLHEYIFVGGIKKGGTWGGIQCYLAIPLDKYIVEIVLWLFLAGFSLAACDLGRHYFSLKRKAKMLLTGHVRTMSARVVDAIFALMHFGIWLLVVYYKICLHSLVNLLQPCHLLLLLQGIAVISSDVHGAMLGSLSFPLIVGAALGLLVPATDGEFSHDNNHSSFVITLLFVVLSMNSPFLRLHIH